MARPVDAQVKCECGFENPFSASTCARCGASLHARAGEAATVVIPGLEADPEVVEVWHRLRDATLGEYDIYAPLGRGGMATVFLALDLALEREVAIKVISPGMIQTQSLVERFKREARTSASLSHPNIIPVYAVKEYEGLAFFIMKYVDGRSLETIIRREGPLSIDVTLDILRQVGMALDFAHRKGVVHRDVKPANIMIDHDGWAIVTDFGIAKVADAGALTSVGLVVGTPTYMSPEQFSGAQVAGAADQYSLGIMAYEMLTGHSPFGSATTVAEMMRSHIMDEPDSPRKFRPDIPDEVASVVLRMLSKNVADRWPSIGDAIDSIQALPQDRQDQARTVMIALAREGAHERPRVSVPISPSPARIRPTKRATQQVEEPRKSRAGMWVAGLLVAAGLGGGGWYMQRARAVQTPVVAPHVADSSLKPKSIAARDTATVAAVDSANQAPPPAATIDPPKKNASTKAPASTHNTPPRAPVGASKSSHGESGKSAAVSSPTVEVAKAPEPVAQAPSAGKAATPAATTPDPAPTKADVVQKAEVVAVAPPPAAATPAPVPAGPPPNGFVFIGSRMPAAIFYLEGKATEAISNLSSHTLAPGKHKIGVGAVGCQLWDTTITVVSNETNRVGYRQPTCPP